MQLDQAILDRFVGGEIEIQNQVEGYMYRGEIGEVEVAGTEVQFRLNWKARAIDYPPIPTGWERDSELSYDVDLLLSTASGIGTGRICITSLIRPELAVLFPPDGSKLDQSKIKDKDTSSAG